MLDVGRLILRLTLAGLVLFHGVDKLLHGIAWMKGPLQAAGLPQFVGYGVFLGEVVAPLLVILGLWTRPAALVIVVNMIMALVLDAGRFILTINSVGGWGVETEAFYLLSAVTLFFVGAGGFSVSRGKGLLS